MRRKVFSILLSVAMVMVMMPSMAVATGTPVAEVTIGDTTTSYIDITDAIKAANDATEDVNVKLLDDVNLNADLGIGSNYSITVNLNGRTINGTQNQIYTKGDGAVLFTGNGTIMNEKASVTSNADVPLNIYSGSKAVLDGVTIEGNYGVYTCGTLEVKNASINAVDCGIAVNQSAQVIIGSDDLSVSSEINVTASAGNCLSTQAEQGAPDMNVTIYNGTFTSSGTTWNGGPMYWAGHGTLNIYGGTFVNETSGTEAAGILQKNGNVNVYEGTFNARDGIKIVAQSDSTEISTDIKGGTFTGVRSGIYIDASNAIYMGNLTKYGVTISNGVSMPVFTGGKEGGLYSKTGGLGSKKLMTVSGGTFNNETSEIMNTYLAVGYVFDDETDTVIAENPVAEANGNKYATLQEAVSAAEAGSIVKLLKDVALSNSIDINKALTLNLNGHNVERTYGYVIKVSGNSANLVICDTSADGNGTIKVNQSVSGNVAVDVSNNGHIELKSGRIIGVTGLHINGASAEINGGYCEGIYSRSYAGTGIYAESGAVVNMKDGKVYGKIYGIGGNGSEGLGSTEINVHGGEIAACDGANEQGCAIFHPQKGVLNLSGKAVLSGSVGVQMCSGILNVSGDVKISVNGLYYTSQYAQGRVPDAAAISVIERGYPGGTPKVNILGGTFDASEAAGNKAIYAHKWPGTERINTGEAPEWSEASEYISVIGGRFSSNVSDYIPEGKFCSPESDAADAMYLVHDHSKTCNLGHVYCPATCEGENICHTLSHYVAPSTPSDSVTNSGTTGSDNAQTNADMSDKVTVSEGTASTVVDQTTADKIVDKAVANESKEVVIDATTSSSTTSNTVSSAQVGIPTATLEAIAEKTDADVTVKTDVAEVKMDNTTAAAVAEQATGDTVQIIAEKVKEDQEEIQFELKVVCSNGTVISDFKGGNVSVTVPVTKNMADKKLVCVYIDDNGIYHKVDGSINEEGTHYTFTTGHFSTYAIMSEEEADAIISKQTAEEQLAKIKKVKTTVTLSTKEVKKGIRVIVKVPEDQKADKTGIIIYRSTSKNAKPYAVYKKVATKGSTYIIRNYYNVKGNRLVKGKTYYYKARAYKVIDGKTYYGPMSTIKYMKAK